MIQIPHDEFEKLVAAGVDAVPPRFRELIKNVAFLVEDEPTPEQRRTAGLADGDMLLGLYEGVPRTERGAEYGGLVEPDRITIFQKPIEEMARDKADIVKIVRDTIWHEVAHHFGLDEDDVERRERERGI